MGIPGTGMEGKFFAAGAPAGSCRIGRDLRLAQAVESVRARGLKGLVPFFTAGYPDDETFLRLVDGAEKARCPVIEVGIPFSDPVADGPVIQAASQAALERGVSLRHSLVLAAEAVRRTSAAIVLMGYFNPILRMGVSRFARLAGNAGVAGVIVPDLPLEESAAVRAQFLAEGVAFVDLVAPTTDASRAGRIAERAAGFLYLVSMTGVTGSAADFTAGLDGFVGRIREACDLPLYVGFGVSGPERARAVTAAADGVIMGSALLKILQDAGDDHRKGARRVTEQLVAVQEAINPGAEEDRVGEHEA